MRCPFCSEPDTVVKDSRPAEDGSSIRRRRQCPSCSARFTTFERVQLRELTVEKTNGEHVPFEREKLKRSLQIALRKRPVNDEQIEKMVTSINRQLESSGEAVIPSGKIGEMVMEALGPVDQVGYVRYASVYKNFRETSDFNAFLDTVRNADDDDENEGKT